jgi:ribokinase
MKRPPQVIVVGTLNVDYIWQVPVLPQPGQTIIADAAERQFGGKGANQAVAVARQGFPVTLVGAVGNDADGQRYREHLLHEGVAAEFVTSVAGAATGAAHVYVDPRGENLIVVNRGANAQLDATVVARVVQPGDVMLLQLECALPAAVAALRFAALQGARSVLNASPVNRNFPWGRQAIEAVVVNQHECREIFAQEPLRLERLSYDERGALLAERKIGHLIVTQGSSPTLHFSAAAVARVPTYPVEPRDTVGAGDTFAGALAGSLAAGVDWPAALWRANVAAALSTLGLGAQAAMPRRAEVDAVGPRPD